MIKRDYFKQWIGKYRSLSISVRSTDGMGRFSGWWNWKVGIQWDRSCVLVSLLIAEIRYYRKPRGCCRCKWLDGERPAGPYFCRCPYSDDYGVGVEWFDRCQHAQNDPGSFPKGE